jgi:hypothetical protein
MAGRDMESDRINAGWIGVIQVKDNSCHIVTENHIGFINSYTICICTLGNKGINASHNDRENKRYDFDICYHGFSPLAFMNSTSHPKKPGCGSQAKHAQTLFVIFGGLAIVAIFAAVDP